MYGLILLFYLAITKALILAAAIKIWRIPVVIMRKPVNMTSRGRVTRMSLASGSKDGGGKDTTPLQTK